MDLLDLLRGRDRSRESGALNRLGDYSRWIIGCGCILVAAVIAGIALLVAGVVQLGEEAIPLVIVAAVIIVAVFSLIRSQF